MDKKEFLSELEKSLSVLQEDELRDIISEYEQHIDIKVEKGLTEAEAIADFGSLQELTAEILEAYHVRVDYAAGTRKSRKKPGKNSGQDGAESLGKLREMGERGSITLWGWIKRAGDWIAGSFKWGWRQLRRPFAWLRSFAAAHSLWYRAADEEENEAVTMTSPGDRPEQDMASGGNGESDVPHKAKHKSNPMGYAQERKGGGKMAGRVMAAGDAWTVRAGVRALGRGIKRIFQWGIEAVLWGIRLAWNGCWVMFSLFTGGIGLFSLFGIGLLAVLLIEGYPLVGVLVGSVGLVFCMFSAAGLGMTLLWRQNAGKTADKRAGEEKESKGKAEGSKRRIHKPGRRPKPDSRERVQQADEAEELQREGDEQDA